MKSEKSLGRYIIGFVLCVLVASAMIILTFQFIKTNKGLIKENQLLQSENIMLNKDIVDCKQDMMDLLNKKNALTNYVLDGK